MNTQHMLDNAATASQAKQLLEPTTRGAILRSIAQWIMEHPNYDTFYHDALVADLMADPEASR